MRISGRCTLSSCVAAAVLAGCGGSQPPIGAKGLGALTQLDNVRSASRVSLDAAAGNLLYVSSSRRPDVSIVTYPQGRRVGTLRLSLAYVTGLCSDPSGNVWVIALSSGQITAYEYAHAGTSPIAMLNVTGDHSSGCAIDPSSGNLAVAHDAYFVSIFPNASGSPETYQDEDVGGINSLVYDTHSNLYLYGYGNKLSSEEVGVLSSGSSSFANFTFNEKARPLTFALWRGNYLLLSGFHTTKGGESTPETIWEVSVKSSGLHVIGEKVFDSRGKAGFGQYACLLGNTLVQPAGSGRSVNLYNYVRGGQPERTVDHFAGGRLTAVAISVGTDQSSNLGSEQTSLFPNQ